MNTDRTAIQHAAKLLSEGKLVAFPTETVYGLGGAASDEAAIQKIFQVKNRPPTNPLIIHISQISAMQNFAREIPEMAYRLAEAFWPGPLTLVLNKQPWVSTALTGGQDTVALRIPNHPVALELLAALGDGIAAPSANRYGELSPTQASHVIKSFGQELAAILDGGSCSVGIESTIISALEETPRILREGHIKTSDVMKVLGCNPLTNKGEHSICVPGLSLKHYAPHKPLYLFYPHDLSLILSQLKEKNLRASILSFEEVQQDLRENAVFSWITVSKDPVLYAQQLYALLHACDENHSDCIMVEHLPLDLSWQAVRDRLNRAASQMKFLKPVPA